MITLSFKRHAGKQLLAVLASWVGGEHVTGDAERATAAEPPLRTRHRGAAPRATRESWATTSVTRGEARRVSDARAPTTTAPAAVGGRTDGVTRPRPGACASRRPWQGSFSARAVRHARRFARFRGALGVGVKVSVSGHPAWPLPSPARRRLLTPSSPGDEREASPLARWTIMNS
jgi:hypothetical protein